MADLLRAWPRTAWTLFVVLVVGGTIALTALVWEGFGLIFAGVVAVAILRADIRKDREERRREQER